MIIDQQLFFQFLPVSLFVYLVIRPMNTECSWCDRCCTNNKYAIHGYGPWGLTFWWVRQMIERQLSIIWWVKAMVEERQRLCEHLANSLNWYGGGRKLIEDFLEEVPSKVKHEKRVGNVIIFNLEWKSLRHYYSFVLLCLSKTLEILIVAGRKDGIRNDSRLHVRRNIDSDIGTLET